MKVIIICKAIGNPALNVDLGKPISESEISLVKVAYFEYANFLMNERLAAQRFKALADPARVRLLRILAELPDEHTVRDPRCGTALGACFCHLTERLGLSAPTVSHHLKILREAGLIEVVRAGRWSYYRLHPAGIEGLLHDLGYFKQAHKALKLEVG